MRSVKLITMYWLYVLVLITVHRGEQRQILLIQMRPDLMNLNKSAPKFKTVIQFSVSVQEQLELKQLLISKKPIQTKQSALQCEAT